MDNFWLNLASKDLAHSRTFFESIGFEMNKTHSGPHMVSMFVGNKSVVLNLFSAEMLSGFGGCRVTDTGESNEIVFSLGADSRADVDAFAKRVVAAGGTLYAQPGEKDGWMYGFGFADPDGHRWSMLYMDMSKMPR